jgi:hypothetical protein
MQRSQKVQKLMDLTRRVQARLALNPEPPPPNMPDPRLKRQAASAQTPQVAPTDVDVQDGN